jgi:hypothetical protein
MWKGWQSVGTMMCLSLVESNCASPPRGIETVPATSTGVPHIDAVNIHEQDNPTTGLIVFQEIVFHAPNGNVTAWRNEIISTSTPAPRINLGAGGTINVSKEQQQKGAIANARFNCGMAHNKYSFVKRITHVDAGGNRSNSFDVTISCH